MPRQPEVHFRLKPINNGRKVKRESKHLLTIHL